ncbi:MAG TPA: hypothetical protein VK702_08535 [Candidatus Acidoferrum sp.]|jgi:hypothetical protein|nr:hypothetical protein [Candidatus Acidoferrum sp.]
MRYMMLGHDRHPHAIADVVIRVSFAALAILTGVGVAFAFWSQLQHSAEPQLLAMGVAALCLGLALIGLAMQSVGTRAFLWLAAATLALAFFAGSGAFSALSS